MPAHQRPYLRTTGHPHIPPESWRERALCLGHVLPPWTWDDTVGDYEIGGQEGRAERAARIERAKEVCRRCPVMDDCLRDVDLTWDEGVRGGVDLRELARAKGRGRILSSTQNGPPLPKDRPVNCPTCGVSVRANNLTRHRRTHGWEVAS